MPFTFDRGSETADSTFVQDLFEDLAAFGPQFDGEARHPCRSPDLMSNGKHHSERGPIRTSG